MKKAEKVKNMAKQIKIRVYPDGKIESETIRIKGKSCLNYIKEIEQLTDAKTVQSKFTEEYHQQEVYNDTYNEGYQHGGN